MKILTEMKLGICYSSLIEKTNVKGLGQADKRLDMFVTANEADICVPYLKKFTRIFSFSNSFSTFGRPGSFSC